MIIHAVCSSRHCYGDVSWKSRRDFKIACHETWEYPVLLYAVHVTAVSSRDDDCDSAMHIDWRCTECASLRGVETIVVAGTDGANISSNLAQPENDLHLTYRTLTWTRMSRVCCHKLPMERHGAHTSSNETVSLDMAWYPYLESGRGNPVDQVFQWSNDSPVCWVFFFFDRPNDRCPVNQALTEQQPYGKGCPPGWA